MAPPTTNAWSRSKPNTTRPTCSASTRTSSREGSPGRHGRSPPRSATCQAPDRSARSGREPRAADRGDMALIRAAAATEHRHRREGVAQRAVLRAELLRVPLVELLGLVELRMAPGGRVQPQAVDAFRPG